MKSSRINGSNFSALCLMLCGLLLSGQLFAAWGNESPWSRKHAELKKQADMEEVIIDTPAIAADPVPMAIEPDPVPMFAEPDPVPMAIEPVVAAPVPEPMPVAVMPDDNGIMSLPSSHYAVQVYASSNTDSMDRYKTNNGLEDLTAVKTNRNGSPMYVLVSLHENRSKANQAAKNLEQITGSKPWVRSVGSLQKIVMQ